MPDDLRPRDIGDMPEQHALAPGSVAEARGRFFAICEGLRLWAGNWWSPSIRMILCGR